MTATLRALAPRVRAQTTWASPLGPLLLARTDRGLAGAWFEGQSDHPGTLIAASPAHDGLLGDTVGALQAYFAGQSFGFGHLPLDLLGTDFQVNVWRALLAIAAGSTCSYRAVAQAIGSPSAVRAVGGAIGRNPISIIVPCHRVIGTNGTLTGYTGGLARKRALLALEGQA